MTAKQNSLPSYEKQFIESNNLMISLLSAREIIEYFPLIKHMTQGGLNYLGSNVTLPEFLDNKMLLITMHLVLGNAGARLLPAEHIINGLIISTIGTGGYAIRLIASDYIKTPEVIDSPGGLAKICGMTMLAYTLPKMIYRS